MSLAPLSVAADSAAATPAAAPSKGETSASVLFKERDVRRQALHAANLTVWKTGPTAVPKHSLESNLKKNTAFVRKVRQSLGQDTKDQILKDLPLLNLEKYLQELIQAIPEGLAKCITAKDCFAATEIVSAFHARFGGDALSVPLTQALALALVPLGKSVYQDVSSDQKEREEAARIARQRPLLRVTTECALVEAVGHSRDTTGQEWIYELVRSLLATDKDHSNVSLLITLLKGLGPVLLNPPDDVSSLTERTGKIMLEGDVGAAPQASALVSSDVKQRFRKLFDAYHQTLARRVVKEHKQLQDQDKKNHEAYIRSGEIFEDRQQNYERMTKSFEKVSDWTRTVSDLLSLPMPQLETASKSDGLALGVNLDSKSAFERRDDEFSADQSPWEDEDSRKFYQELLDLGDIIPPSILAKTVDPSSSQGESQSQNMDEAAEAHVPTLAVEDSPGEETMSAGPAAHLSTLFAKLPDMTNRTMIDSAAVDFAFIASKQARKKLVKHLAAIPRNRTDLLPYYARLTATLHRYMPDIGTSLVAILEDEFRYFQKKRNVDLGESRAKNVKFLAELTKFQVTPIHVIFHCLKVCLEDFSGSNIDVLATLLETCGRYLLRTEDTSARTRSMLEMLRRKRAAINLDHRQLLMLDNAYYHCNPPERKAIEQKKRSPMQAYIRHLMYNTLSKKTLNYVVDQLRKLHWDDAQVYSTLVELFTRCWKVKFSNIHMLAILVYDLERHHPEFAIDVIDQLLESVRIGMEQNIFQHNQRRVASICYLGELYNYRLVNSSIVFEQMWSLTTFAHPKGRPLPGQIAPLDAPDDYFRIRLVCSLLDTCGLCFDSGSLKKRLDEFLVFFNLYTLTKEQPLPMDIDFMLTGTLETIRPHLKWNTNFSDAAQAFDEMTAAHRLAAPSGVGTSLEENDDDEDEEDEDEQEGENIPRTRKMRSLTNAGSDTSDTDDNGDRVASNAIDNNEDDGAEVEAILRRREEEQAIKEQARDDFDRELAKMMAESSSSGPSHSTASGGGGAPSASRSSLLVRGGTSGHSLGYGLGKSSNVGAGSSGGPGSGKLSEIGLPVRRSTPVSQADAAPNSHEDTHMNFSLLSKKGSKQVTQSISMPSTTSIAINTRTKQLKDEEERKRLKQLVLAYERGAGNSQSVELEDLEHQLRSYSYKVRSNGP